MLKIRRPLGRLIFNMGIAIPGKTVFLIETAPRRLMSYFTRLERAAFTYKLYCMFYLPIFDKRMIHTFGFMVIFFGKTSYWICDLLLPPFPEILAVSQYLVLSMNTTLLSFIWFRLVCQWYMLSNYLLCVGIARQVPWNSYVLSCPCAI